MKSIYLKISGNIQKKIFERVHRTLSEEPLCGSTSILLQKLNTRCPDGLTIIEYKDVK